MENKEYYEDEIDLSEIFAAVWRRKWFVLGIVFVSLVVAGGVCLKDSETVTRARIRLNFDGMDKHVYPDGTNFEMNDIIAPDILADASAAIADNDLRNIFLSDYRKFIRIEPTKPAEVRERKDSKGNVIEEYFVFPDQFYLDFVQQRNGRFSPGQCGDIIMAVTNSYEEKFRGNYVDRSLISLDIGKNTLENHDYMDAVEILGSRAADYENFIDARIASAGHYRSPVTGKSFVDLKSGVANIRNISLSEMESIIKTSHLTREKESLSNQLRYSIQNLERQRQKKQRESEIAIELLERVWEQEKTVSSKSSGKDTPLVFGDASMLETLKDREYVSFLLQRALDAGVDASSLKVEKEFVETELEALSAEGKGSRDIKFTPEYVDARIDAIRKKLLGLGQSANYLNQEYLDMKYSNIIKIQKQPVTGAMYEKSPSKVMLLTLVVSFMLAVFIALVAEYVSASKRRREEEAC